MRRSQGDVTPVVAIRGATTASEDSPAVISSATRELLEALVQRNALESGDIVSVLFAVTGDLRADYPARAARGMGWTDVPLLCVLAQPVDGSVPMCIRVLLHVRWRADQGVVTHVYLRGARGLRPDLAGDL